MFLLPLHLSTLHSRFSFSASMIGAFFAFVSVALASLSTSLTLWFELSSLRRRQSHFNGATFSSSSAVFFFSSTVTPHFTADLFLSFHDRISFALVLFDLYISMALLSPLPPPCSSYRRQRHTSRLISFSPSMIGSPSPSS
ncbi:uncharacterized protein LOC128041948 [Gossypium raimondii]|uniref:uncharacterized protein LOC128041948 n=1 Tax=Gossypium raimondii TaxID=29730 RepID=UPI00227AB3E0|nr:uncharacterized protein LOC128041948 [Gossypium raimondii]